MESASTTSSRRSVYQKWREKLSRTKSLPPEPVSCERCGRIDHLIRFDLNWNSRLHKAPDVFSDSLQLEFDLDVPLACPFCQLLLDAFQRLHGPCKESKQNILIYFIDVAYKHTPRPGSWGIAVVRDDVVPPSKKRPIGYNYAPLRREYRRQQGLILPVADGKVPDSQGRVACLVESSVNYATLRRRIQKCNDGHSKCSTISQSFVYGMLVIDCESYEIVPLMPEQKYCTLSYVSGEHESVQRGVESAKNHNAWPRTFLDAVHVVLSLGYRYLWIDRYCITNRDAEVSRLQISMMDRIYGAAELTIVAAAGTDCHAGLPGAGTSPPVERDRQKQALLNGVHYVLALPNIDSIQNTKWASRGWTYQEAVLSRRCIVFTQEQVFFICQSDFFAEMMPSTPQLTTSFEHNITLQTLFSNASPERLLRRGSDPSREGTSLDALKTHIKTYGTRFLTYEEDALDACRGILAQSGYWTYWAIPCIPTQGAKHPCRDTKSSELTIPIFSERTHFTLGVLRGLAWYVDRLGASDTRNRTRTTVPSWSLLSRINGRVRFLCDPEHITSGHNPYFFGISDEIEISIPERTDDNSVSAEILWMPLSTSWESMRFETKVIPEQGFLLKLDAPVADVVQVVVDFKNEPGKEDERTVLIGYLTKSKTQIRQLIAVMDDNDALPRSASQQVFTNVNWRLLKISSWTHCAYTDQNESIPSAITAAYLIIAPKGVFWTRKGIAVTPGFGSRAVDGQPVAMTTVTLNQSLPAQTTSRIPSLNDDGFQVMSVVLT